MYRMFEGDCLSINIYFDGACNPPNAYGKMKAGIVFEQRSKVVHYESKLLGKGDNNTAEFKALKFALEQAIEHGYTSANCFGDSSIVIDSLNNHCSPRSPKYYRLILDIEALATKFDWISFVYVKRNTGFHAVADQLSKV